MRILWYIKPHFKKYQHLKSKCNLRYLKSFCLDPNLSKECNHFFVIKIFKKETHAKGPSKAQYQSPRLKKQGKSRMVSKYWIIFHFHFHYFSSFGYGWFGLTLNWELKCEEVLITHCILRFIMHKCPLTLNGILHIKRSSYPCKCRQLCLIPRIKNNSWCNGFDHNDSNNFTASNVFFRSNLYCSQNAWSLEDLSKFVYKWDMKIN